MESLEALIDNCQIWLIPCLLQFQFQFSMINLALYQLNCLWKTLNPLGMKRWDPPTPQTAMMLFPVVPLRRSAHVTASCRGSAFICNNTCLWYVMLTCRWLLNTCTHTCCRIGPHACGPKLYSEFDLTPVAQKLYSSVASASIWMIPSQDSINARSLIMDASRVALAAVHYARIWSRIISDKLVDGDRTEREREGEVVTL